MHAEATVQSETEKSQNLYLYIDMPRFDFPVIFSEPVSTTAAEVMEDEILILPFLRMRHLYLLLLRQFLQLFRARYPALRQ